MSNKTDHLIFDVSGLLYRTYFTAKAVPQRKKAGLFEDDDEDSNPKDDLASFALHTALMSMNKYFKQFKPDRVIACFDRPNNWRKQYMASELSVSKRPYKGNRRQGMSDAQQAEYFKLLEHMAEFESLLEHETGIITLANDGLEADDCIAGWIQRHPTARKVIMTNDSDMSQLIDDNTSVCNFTSGKIVECDDPKYFLFEKTFRGDTADNIASVMPGIRSTKIRKAFEDPFTLANILGEQYIAPSNPDQSLLVRDAFEENQLLMDLTKQPQSIRKKIDKTIDEELSKTKKFDFWKFSAFCTERKLNNILTSIQTFRPMLVGGYHNVR
jgi:hypothetical protein